MENEIKKMIELSDEELLDMVGGYVSDSLSSSAKIEPPIRLFYGIKIPPIDVKPLYGIEPGPIIPLYGIKPEIE
ncbi:hypothetical protein EHE19_004660 [Ruminiclostridium herbifermentans]|uniref:Uncharacterized protein n=1 Tax=Ruminiclostridium herbifermentans TaxID=2488810 RepID=A0A4V6EQH9_9FIRM|nr:hypothetical protein [Ruminiclostridium herbifermentans]QNU67760.1 hypothetical protein EHE19_004660 [Ruminiclostridium herbifermentans]